MGARSRLELGEEQAGQKSKERKGGGVDVSKVAGTPYLKRC